MGFSPALIGLIGLVGLANLDLPALLALDWDRP